ncbi:hypothetical protein EBZ39_13570 [bacterium]|nr:hypothetical protein [bacterium]
MQTMPFSKNFVPRKGQAELIKRLSSIKTGDRLTVQWPMGYGKSVGFALAWKECVQKQIANRLLLVVANDTQRTQIINDFASECELVGAPCPGGVWDFERSARDLRACLKGTSVVFVCTIHQMEAACRGGLNVMKDLLTTPGTAWSLGFDEYHHYALDMAWGDAVISFLPLASFVAAMSATPYRRNQDTVFGLPDLSVSYSQAVAEGAVKPMVIHSYNYEVTAIMPDNEVKNYKTSELLEQAPDGLDSWEERKEIRYSPQYIHPLIVTPLQRLQERRIETGVKLQALFRAMSCLHAKAVCEQIRMLTGTDSGALSVDWVGTGINGRSDLENEKIKQMFCPKKVNGKRPAPQLDILVSVNSTNEGFDSIPVCEIVDLFPVSKKALSGVANQDKQFYGRGSRIVAGAETIPCIINIPTDHPLNEYTGKNLHGWLDSSGNASPEDCESANGIMPEFDLFKIPEIPKRRKVELIEINEQYKERFREAMRADGYVGEIADDALEKWARKGLQIIGEKESDKLLVNQRLESIDFLVGRAALIKAKTMQEVNSTVIGRFKKQINGELKRRFGERERLLPDELARVFEYMANMIEAMRN